MVSLNETQKGLILQTWKNLSQSQFTTAEGISESGITRFFSIFKELYLYSTSTSKALFENIPMQNQARSVVRMLTTIVQYVEYSQIVIKKIHYIMSNSRQRLKYRYKDNISST